MKKSLAIILVLVLSISMLTGCMGGNKPDTTLGTTSPQVQTSANAEIAGIYELVDWYDKDDNFMKYLPESGIRAEDFYIELRGDGTYTWDLTVVDGGIDKGTYKVTDSSTLVLTYDGGVDTLAISGNRITYIDRDDTWVFEKSRAAQTPSREFNFSEVLDAATPVTAEQLLEYYDLTSAERRLYDQIVEGVAKFDMRIGIDINIKSEADKAMASKIWGLVQSTHPEFFWFRNYDYYPDSRPGEDGKYPVLPLYVVDGRILRARFDGPDKIDYPSEGQVAEAKAWVESAKKEIRERLNALPVHTGMSPFELEVAVYDWLRDNVLYNETSDFDTLFNYKNMYGALINGEGDCMGYSRAFQYIMCLMGIECLDIGGAISKGGVAAAGLHGWNAVKLDGEWYHADVTNDSWGHLSLDWPWHLYLNRTNQYMADNGYIIGDDKSGLTVNIANITCTATKYDYYLMTDAYIASDADFAAKVPARITRAKENGEWGFDMKVDPSYANSDRLVDNWFSLNADVTANAHPYYDSDKCLFYVVFEKTDVTPPAQGNQNDKLTAFERRLEDLTRPYSAGDFVKLAQATADILDTPESVVKAHKDWPDVESVRLYAAKVDDELYLKDFTLFGKLTEVGLSIKDGKVYSVSFSKWEKGASPVEAYEIAREMIDIIGMPGLVQLNGKDADFNVLENAVLSGTPENVSAFSFTWARIEYNSVRLTTSIRYTYDAQSGKCLVTYGFKKSSW